MTETIKCGTSTKELKHNTIKWRVRTNRHPSTRGRLWGWIDGPSENVCWNNEFGSSFTREDADCVVKAHNKWLEEQTPLDIRIVEKELEINNLHKEVVNLQDELYTKKRDYELLVAELEELKTGGTK